MEKSIKDLRNEVKRLQENLEQTENDNVKRWICDRVSALEKKIRLLKPEAEKTIIIFQKIRFSKTPRVTVKTKRNREKKGYVPHFVRKARKAEMSRLERQENKGLKR